MKVVYLINKQDAYCPENNNGDYIIAAFLNREEAIEYVGTAEEDDSSYSFLINEMEISGTLPVNTNHITTKLNDVESHTASWSPYHAPGFDWGDE